MAYAGRRAARPSRWLTTRGRPADRKRTAREGGERLGGHPDGRLSARARVADAAVRRDERPQVAERTARSGALHAVRIAAGGHERLDRPGGRLRVRSGPGREREAAVRVLRAGDERGAAGDRPAPRAAGGDERLQRGGGVVDPTRRAAAAEVPAAVAVLLARDPRRGAADGPVAGWAAGRAQGEHGERGAVDEALERAVGAATAQQRRDEVRPAGPARRATGRDEAEDRALDVAGVGHARRARGDEAARGGRDAPADGGEAHRRPGGLEVGRGPAG